MEPVTKIRTLVEADPIEDKKYAVVKRSDLVEMIQTLIGGEEPPAWVMDEIESYVLNDAVVIRTHDVFAGPALHSYAHSINLVAELTTNPERRAHLRRSADYFADRAREADVSHYDDRSKYPDHDH